MTYGQLAIAAHREDRVEEALKYYRLYLDAQPQSGEGWLGLGMLFHMKMGDIQNAIDCYRKAVEFSPSAWLADLHLGTLLCELDHPASAIIYLDKYVRANPYAGKSAYSDLVCAYVRTGRLDEASEVAGWCRRHYPDDYYAPFLASWVAAQKSNLNEAIYHATDSAALDPMWPVPLGLKGLLLSRAGRLEEARRVLQEMVTIQCSALKLSAPPEMHIAACRLWRHIRHDAKRQLGLDEFQAANFLILKGGLGDQFCMATKLLGFRTSNNRLPLIVVSSPSFNWKTMFAESADLFIHLDSDQIHQLEICNRFLPDHPYTTFFPWFGPLGSIASAREVFNFTLGLPSELRGCEPTISDDIKQSSLALFHGLGGKANRSILISPLSNSNPMLGHEWWQALVDELDRAGFVVFENMTNMWNSNRPVHLARAIPVEMPPEQAIPFCEAAGFFIGMRNGLCDLLGYAKARMKAIHVPRRYAKNDRYPLSVWFDANSTMSLRQRFESDYWEDINIEAHAEFNPSIVADWINMPTLHA